MMWAKWVWRVSSDAIKKKTVVFFKTFFFFLHKPIYMATLIKYANFAV